MKEVTVEAENGHGGAYSSAGSRGVVRRGGGDDCGGSYQVMEDKPSKFEVMGWYLYELCSYFIQTVLIPLVFPLIISQLQHLPSNPDPVQDWHFHHPGLTCPDKEIHLYRKLTQRTISVSGSHFSSLEWTSIAWASGLAMAAPILGFVSYHLDRNLHPIIAAAATGVGALFCLPAGFFKITKIFIPYIAGIVAASTVAGAAHNHHLGLMVHAFTGPFLTKPQYRIRQAISHRLSLYSAAIGSVGAAIISAFTYHMLDEPNEHEFISLWIVSIFSGLLWLVGVLHVYTSSNRAASSLPPPSKFHPFSILKYPHAIGGLAGVFLSSFTTMCIFIGGVIFIVGQQCIKPLHLLFLWLTYFLFPLLSLPLLQPFQHLIRIDAVRMQILGFLLSIFSSGFGFFYNDNPWKWGYLLIFGAIQGTSAGVLHASGRILVMECAPAGKEGAFAIWLSWLRAAGLCAGLTVGSVVPARRIRTSFGSAFCGALVGILGLLFSKVSDVGGAVAAGHVIAEESERGSNAASGLDSKEREGSRV
ncbi:uncharacterized protein LOC129284501 [Prosopis cineraria]|uniref:uncharacterized protein LOC129284501 n=1 Tax=Prosopis cineraria TaxID=364024 RepID=UPI00240F6B9C|nr:uncharacterized protein LOC129284501 [Prosopis cineraria]